VVATALVLATLAVAGWWWRHPTVLEALPESQIGQEPVGHAMLFGITRQSFRGVSGVVTLHNASANAIRDSGAARIEFFVCVLNPKTGNFTSVHDNRPWCASRLPIAGAVLPLRPNVTQQLVMSLTLMRPGRLEIHGVDVTYTRGHQSGTQHLDGLIVLETL